MKQCAPCRSFIKEYLMALLAELTLRLLMHSH